MKKNQITKIHEECPNETHCTKDETKCCYLVKNHCILKREVRNYGRK